MSVSFAKSLAFTVRDNPTESSTPPLADRVLLVEDCEEDIFQFQRLLRRSSTNTALDVVTDGESAVKWLTERLREHERGTAALPRALFVDLRLPGIRGSEVLQWIRRQSAIDRALVVVWSSSIELCDIAEADRLGADLYVNKFPTVEQFSALLRVTDPRALRPEMFGDHRGALR